nr:hypothetical protein [Tanacetum cinerariifolium]
QVALDEALVPHANRLRIGKSNFRLRSDITSKESTLQVVYDVLRLTLLYKAFLVTADTFDELMFKEEILAFLRYLGHSGEIKKITDVNINKLHQPWRSFAAVINKCLCGKSTGYDSLRDDQMFTMIKLVSRHQNTQQFSAMLPVELTNEDIKNSAAYKEYYAIASGAAPPKTKASVRKTQISFDTTMPPPTTAGTRLSTSVKGKQPAKSSKAKDEGTGIIPGVLDVPTYESYEEISWKSSDEDDDDNVDDQSDADDDDDDDDDDQDDNDDEQDSDNDGDDFVHPKLSTHDEEAKDEESFDPIVQTPSQVEKSDNESNDDESYGMNVGEDEGPNAEDDEEELYRDVNINLEGRDVQMIDVHTTQVLEDTHVTLTSVNPDGIDSLFESTHWVDVPVMTIVVPLLVTAPTLPLPSIPIISEVQQATAPTPVTTLNIFLQDLLNFSSLFGFDHRLKTLEANFSEFMQTNQFAKAVSSIPDEQRNLYKALVDAYECDKIILDTYGDTVTLKRRCNDEDKDEEPSAGSDRGSKRRREGKEPITSKESTLQVVYDVLRLTLLYKAFLVTVDVPEIHMQEFWATATFNSFQDEQQETGEIKKITDVNINKLHQPCRSFAAVINKCLCGKSTGYDSLRHQNTQQFSAMLPVELTNEDIKNSAAYKEYYAIASGAAPPKTKASVRKMQISFDTTMPPPTTAGTRLSTSVKRKQPAKSSKAKGLFVLSEKSSDEDDDDDDQDDNDDEQDSDNDDDDFVHPKLSTHDEEAKDKESFDPIVQTPSQVEKSDNESNDDESYGMNVDVPVTTIVVPLLVTAPTLPLPSIPIISEVQQAPAPTPVTTLNIFLQDLLNFSSLFGFDHRLKTLEANFSEFMQTNQFAKAVSSIPAQAENEDFVNKLDENIQKIINDQVKKQVKTSYVVAADLSELELKKILIEKIESNKSIHRSDEQRNLYKALVDAYECDKINLDTYGDTVMLKRRRNDEDKDEEPSAGSDRGSKRRREGKEPESTSDPKEKGIQDS